MDRILSDSATSASDLQLAAASFVYQCLLQRDAASLRALGTLRSDKIIRGLNFSWASPLVLHADGRLEAALLEYQAVLGRCVHLVLGAASDGASQTPPAKAGVVVQRLWAGRPRVTADVKPSYSLRALGGVSPLHIQVLALGMTDCLLQICDAPLLSQWLEDLQTLHAWASTPVTSVGHTADSARSSSHRPASTESAADAFLSASLTECFKIKGLDHIVLAVNVAATVVPAGSAALMPSISDAQQRLVTQLESWPQDLFGPAAGASGSATAASRSALGALETGLVSSWATSCLLQLSLLPPSSPNEAVLGATCARVSALLASDMKDLNAPVHTSNALLMQLLVTKRPTETLQAITSAVSHLPLSTMLTLLTLTSRHAACETEKQSPLSRAETAAWQALHWELQLQALRQARIGDNFQLAGRLLNDLSSAMQQPPQLAGFLTTDFHQTFRLRVELERAGLLEAHGRSVDAQDSLWHQCAAWRAGTSAESQTALAHLGARILTALSDAILRGDDHQQPDQSQSTAAISRRRQRTASIRGQTPSDTSRKGPRKGALSAATVDTDALSDDIAPGAVEDARDIDDDKETVDAPATSSTVNPSTGLNDGTEEAETEAEAEAEAEALDRWRDEQEQEQLQEGLEAEDGAFAGQEVIEDDEADDEGEVNDDDVEGGDDGQGGAHSPEQVSGLDAPSKAAAATTSIAYPHGDADEMVIGDAPEDDMEQALARDEAQYQFITAPVSYTHLTLPTNREV